MTSAFSTTPCDTIIVPREDLKGLVVTGPDRSAWLMGMLTCDLAPLSEGSSVYGLILDRRGKVLSDLFAFEHESRIVLAVDATGIEDLQQHLDHFLIMEDAEIEVLDAPHSFINVFGPHSADVAAAAKGMTGVQAATRGILCGTEAALIMVGDNGASEVTSRLADIDPATVTMTLAQFDEHRLPAGIPKLRVDFGIANYPGDIGLEEHAISFNKGCYVGQEVVVKLRSRGKPVNVLRRVILPREAAVPTADTPVSIGSGKVVGRISSASRTREGTPIAFALLRRADTEKLDEVLVDDVAAKIVAAWGPIISIETQH